VCFLICFSIESNLCPMASELNCQTPYLDRSTGCTTTYADSFGNGYKAYHAIFAILSVIIFLVAVVQTYRIVKFKKGLRPVDLQRFLHYVCSICALTFVLRAIDPEAWSGVNPFWFNGLMTETCSAVIYCGVMSLVLSWVKLILKLSGSDRDHKIIRRLRTMKYIVQPSLIFFQNLFTQMVITHGPTCKWRICLFLMYPIFNLLMLAIGLYYGLTIFKTLAKLSHSTGGGGGQTSNSPTSEDFSETSTAKEASVQISSKDVKVDVTNENKEKEIVQVPSSPSQISRDGPDNNNNNNSASPPSPRGGANPTNSANNFNKKKPEEKKKKHKEPSNDTKIGMLRRLLVLLALFTIVSVISICLQLLQIPMSIQTQDDFHTKPLDPPQSIIGSVYFSILQYVAVVIVLVFFRTLHGKKPYQDQSSGGGGSAYGNAPASPRNKPAKAPIALQSNPPPLETPK